MLNYEVVEILKDLSPSSSIVALDLETTGLDINKDRIIEIGATKLNLDTGEFENYSQEGLKFLKLMIYLTTLFFQ